MFSILSWNIRQGGGSRVKQIVDNLLKLKPELIVLSEYRNNDKGAFIRAKLLAAGYLHQSVGHDMVDKNTVLMASKLPYIAHPCQEADPIYKSAIIYVEFEAFSVYGMYLPHKKKHVLFKFLVNAAKSEKPAIMVGDFNTGINYIDQKSNSFMYSEYLEKLKKESMLDAFRLINGDLQEYSWYSHQGNGFRYDHSYVHSDLKLLVKECSYLHQWREDKISDHSPMLLTLG